MSVTYGSYSIPAASVRVSPAEFPEQFGKPHGRCRRAPPLKSGGLSSLKRDEPGTGQV